MTDYKPKPGDRVRVTFEGTVSARVAGDTYFVMGDNNDSVPVWPGAPVVSVEKVAPPYRDPEFEHGMYLRNADDPDDGRVWMFQGDHRFWSFLLVIGQGQTWNGRDNLPKHLASTDLSVATP